MVKKGVDVAVLETNLAELEKAIKQAALPRFHVVKDGQSLWDLALEYYGDGRKFGLIYRANAAIIKDPGWVYPGQKLQIPEQP